MLTLHVKNLRSIEDSGPIKLCPLTLVVGRNSAGKSTLLRVLPLLRQSVERRTSGPILWFGDLVDFGSFGEAVRWGVEKKEIELEVGFSWDTDYARNPWAVGGGRRTEAPVTLGLTLGNGDRAPAVVRVAFRCGDQTLEVDIAPDGRWASLLVNGRLADLKHVTPLSTNERVPFVSWRSEDVNPEDTARPVLEAAGWPLSSEIGEHAMWSRTLFWHPDLASTRGLFARRNPPFFRGVSEEQVRRVHDALFTRDAAYILLSALQTLAAEAAAVAYIGPFRAPPARHYRVSELSNDVVDADGTNTAMVVRSLSPAARENLNLWLTQHLGFGLELGDTDAHVQLRISEGALRAANLIDVGYGVSQLLPVAVQLWMMSHPRDDAAPAFRTCVIEQPELHLHPAHQARLGALLASLAQEASRRVGRPEWSLLVETHSAELVEAVGRAIFEGELPPSAAQIVIVEKGDVSGDSTVRVATFDERGELQNWPVGFFVP
jgi:hypothetical protein